MADSSTPAPPAAESAPAASTPESTANLHKDPVTYVLANRTNATG